MNMISQLPQPARFEAVGERRLPVQVPIAQWTDKERRCNRIIEDLMSLAHEKAKLKEQPPVERPCTSARKAQGEKTRRAILAAMSHPMTAVQIAKHLNAKRSTVGEHLRVMAFEGLVVAEGGGGSVAATYRRVAK